jgi:hypothetical protein
VKVIRLVDRLRGQDGRLRDDQRNGPAEARLMTRLEVREHVDLLLAQERGVQHLAQHDVGRLVGQKAGRVGLDDGHDVGHAVVV